MNLTIEIIPEHKMAYMRRVGPYGLQNIQTMENLKTWASQNDLLQEDTVILGIALDNPQVTPPEHCRYDTCLVMDPVQEVLVLPRVETTGTTEQLVQIGTTPHGKFAIFQIPHTPEGVQEAWQNIFPSLAGASLELDPSRPIVERYAEKKVKQHLCEICVPVF